MGWAVAACTASLICQLAAWPEVYACRVAGKNKSPHTQEICEQAWVVSGNEETARVAAADAFDRRDDAQLARWVGRALPTVDGARILHFWGERREESADRITAELAYRVALAWRGETDPGRATNDALRLFELSRSSRPAVESIAWARRAWELAERAKGLSSRVFAAEALIRIFIDVGELGAATAIFKQMDRNASAALHDLAQGRLEAALGHSSTAASLFSRSLDPRDPNDQGNDPVAITLDLVQALLELGEVTQARAALEATKTRQKDEQPVLDESCRLAAAEALVAQAEGNLEAAQQAVDRGLALPSVDSARLVLLEIRGELLARQGNAGAAESAWKEAAKTLDYWRTSVPTTQLRRGLVGRHRRILDAWLESAARRGDAETVLEVVQRMMGRTLLDRMRQREANETPAADAAITDVLGWLELRRELEVPFDEQRPLRDAPLDVDAIVRASDSFWGVRHRSGHWRVDRLGDRSVIQGWLNEYREHPDDTAVADSLGSALFPLDVLPKPNAPLTVLLDPELTDLILPGLRVHGKYLIERTSVVEVMAPDLLFSPMPKRSSVPAVVLGDAGGDLPAARREAEDVARQLSVDAMLGPAAKRSLVLEASGARVLHVAGHSESLGGRWALVLADGVLMASDIASHRLSPRLAVIASCRSHRNDDPATSLVAAFQAAGTAGVVGVKRLLDDEDGARLMHDFYRFGGADDPVRGLALAQRSAIANGRPALAWATVSFFGIGAWATEAN